MNEERMETRLARYRPVAPPSDLRSRVVGAMPRRRTPWVAIAAMTFLTLTLRILASARHVAVLEQVSNTSTREALVREFAEQLGGEPIALETARVLIEYSDTPRFK